MLAEGRQVINSHVVCACGHAEPIVLRPLFLVVGPSGAGKSMLALRLPGLLPEAVVLDGDVLWGLVPPEQVQTAWLRMSVNLAQGDRPVVLLSSFTGGGVQHDPLRPCIGPIHTLGLVCDDAVLAARLRARPPWRGCDDAHIATMVDWNAHLRTQTDFPTIDTTDLTVNQAADALRSWVLGHLAR